MSSVSIYWDSTAPADSDGAGYGAGQIRSLKTAIETGLAAEHDWPASTGNAGAHKEGAARTFVGPSSQISSADTTGRLMWDTTHEALYYLSSASTAYVGGRNALSVTNSGMTAGIGNRVQTSFYSLSGTSWPSGLISFSPAFVATPYVTVSLVTTSVPTPIDDTKKATIAKVGYLYNAGCKIVVIDGDTMSASSTYATIHLMVVGAVAI